MIKVEYFTFNPVQENTYIVYDDKKNCVIIDPGFFYPEEERDFFSFIEKEELVPKLLLLTHAHYDHIFGLQKVVNQTSLVPFLHSKEKIILDNAATYAGMLGLPLGVYEGKIQYIEEGQELDFGSQEKIQFFLTSGHSPGSLSFYFPKSSVLFSGDCLFRESIGRTDLPMANFDELCTNIKNKLYILSEDTKVYPGHGEPTTIGHEKKFNPFVIGK